MLLYLQQGIRCVVLIYLLSGTVAQQNFPPAFDPCCDMEGFSIAENTPVGKTVYKLFGRDPEGFDVVYGIEGDGTFSINRNTGDVVLARAIDREYLVETEGVDVIDVVLTLEDHVGDGRPNNKVRFAKQITVTDENDNDPEFTGTPYSFTVNETSPIGSIVYSSVSIIDRDKGFNSDIFLSCTADFSGTCDYFQIREQRISEGHFTGIVTLIKELDYERQTSFAMKIRAQDGGIASRHATADVFIQVDDAQDVPPRFLGTPYFVNVKEGTTLGLSVLSIAAADGDRGNPRQLQFDLIGDNLGYFIITSTFAGDKNRPATAELTTTGIPIDREEPEILNNGGVYALTIRATELIEGRAAGDTTDTSLVVIIVDENDNIPQFSKSRYSVTIPEDLPVNSALPNLDIVVSDRDVGENAAFNLSLEGANDKFDVFPKTAVGSVPVIIKVRDESGFDYEDAQQRQHEFTIVATESNGQSATAVVTVSIADVNDNGPVFPEEYYQVSIAESEPSGTSLLTITASDADSGIFGELEYSIQGVSSEKFNVDPSNGHILIAQCNTPPCIDAEMATDYSLTYTAKDAGGKIAAVPLYINITDVNDNAPIFSHAQYETSIKEGSNSFDFPLFVLARDDDVSDENSKIRYYITAGNQIRAFAINEVSGEIEVVKPVSYADTPGESGTYELIVEARDSGTPPQSSTVSVLIHVVDQNNNAPEFEFNEYSSSVSETSESGTRVIRVTATDKDYGQNGFVTYRMGTGSKSNFLINETTGWITVSDGSNLDREIYGSVYNISVIATDAGMPNPLSGFTHVVISIADVNNKPPIFTQTLYIGKVTEQSSRGQTVATVSASDPDESADIRYAIVEPVTVRFIEKQTVDNLIDYKTVFDVDGQTGVVSVATPGHFHGVESMVLAIQADDINARTRNQMTRTNLEIFIQKEEKEEPKFLFAGALRSNEIRISIQEELPVGQIIFRLAAIDPVTNEPIKNYEKVEDIDDYFNVATESGFISIRKRLNYEDDLFLPLRLVVVAIGPRGHQSFVTLIIDVEDINDNVPEFLQDTYIVEVKESSRSPMLVIQIQAVDKDTKSGYGTVGYTLSGAGYQNFHIDNQTGWISLSETASLDRELTPVYHLIGKATDQPDDGAAPQEASVIVTVVIGDENDHAPKFEQRSYRTATIENIHTQAVILQVVARDRDDPQELYGQLRYSINERGNAGNLFSVNSNTGEVYATNNLIGRASPVPYNFQVTACDKGASFKCDTASVSVIVGSVLTHDGRPRFITPPSDDTLVAIAENSPVGTSVYVVSAYDSDDPDTPFGTVRYSFQEGLYLKDQEKFSIHSLTGLIKTRMKLDREEQENYSLPLMASDQGRPPQFSTRILTVMLEDINDNVPTFIRHVSSPPQRFEVSENIDVGSEVGRVEAVDRDGLLNNKIFYYIVCGNEDNKFELESTTGIIRVSGTLDRENRQKYILCIKASEHPITRPTRQTDDEVYDPNDKSIILAEIDVTDRNDHAPEFLSSVSGSISVSVLARAAVGTQVTRLKAIDADEGMNSDITFKLNSISFLADSPAEGPKREVPYAFRIDPLTGAIYTNSSLGKYTQGYFVLEAEASNPRTESELLLSSRTTVFVHVLRDNHRVKLVFNKHVDEVKQNMEDLVGAVEAKLADDSRLQVDEYLIHLNERTNVLRPAWTDVCVHVIRDDKILEQSEARDLLDDERNPSLTTIYGQYGLVKITHCGSRETPKLEALAIVLIAFAVFIFFCVLALIIAACCIAHKYHKKFHSIDADKAEPIIYHPPSIYGAATPGPGPPMLPYDQQSTLPLPLGSEAGFDRVYEWQEKSVNMKDGGSLNDYDGEDVVGGPFASSS